MSTLNEREFAIRVALFQPYCDIMQILHTESPNDFYVQEWIYNRISLFMESIE